MEKKISIDKQRLQSVAEFCQLLIEGLERYKPMDYRDTVNILITILKKIEQ